MYYTGVEPAHKWVVEGGNQVSQGWSESKQGKETNII